MANNVSRTHLFIARCEDQFFEIAPLTTTKTVLYPGTICKELDYNVEIKTEIGNFAALFFRLLEAH
jgi:hypothetical protein